MNGESASLAESTDALIVAPPRDAKLQAFILIFDAQPIADRLPAIGERQRVLSLVGEIDDACAEDRPIAAEQDARGDAQFLLVAEILDRRIDVPVEPEIADLRIGLGGADCEVDLVAADGERMLVDALAV